MMDNTDPLEHAFRFNNFSNVLSHNSVQGMFSVLFGAFAQQPSATKFLILLMKNGMQSGFKSNVPAILLRNLQDFESRSDFAKWGWYVGEGHQLWDTHIAKPIYVLARSEWEAYGLFYHIAEPELDYVNQLPSGTDWDYDDENEDIEFKYYGEPKLSVFDCAWKVWNDSQATE